MPIKILMPALSPTMTEGNLIKWHKKVGDNVKSGDILAEIETDKATMEVEAVDEGKLARILVAEGTEEVKVNTLIALLLEEGEDESALEGIEAEAPQAPVIQEVKSEKAQAQVIQAAAISEGRVFATPLARRIAEQSGVELTAVAGSGPRGRIIKSDVEAALSKPALRSVPQRAPDELYPAYDEVKLTNVRKIIAQRLTEAKQTVPHFYLTVECEIEDLLKARKVINASLGETEKISVNDFVIKACALALKKVPEANASWGGDHIKLFKEADISVAVAAPGGLVTPIIRNADTKTLGEIARESKELIAKARDGKLKPQEFQGGTFSVSNLGMFGIRDFAAIINPPQGCILAVGAGEERAVVKNGEIRVATVMNCTLSVDHRVVDGAIGAEFLKHFKNFVSHPILMML